MGVGWASPGAVRGGTGGPRVARGGSQGSPRASSGWLTLPRGAFRDCQCLRNGVLVARGYVQNGPGGLAGLPRTALGTGGSPQNSAGDLRVSPEQRWGLAGLPRTALGTCGSPQNGAGWLAAASKMVLGGWRVPPEQRWGGWRVSGTIVVGLAGDVGAGSGPTRAPFHVKRCPGPDVGRRRGHGPSGLPLEPAQTPCLSFVGRTSEPPGGGTLVPASPTPFCRDGRRCRSVLACVVLSRILGSRCGSATVTDTPPPEPARLRWMPRVWYLRAHGAG